MSVIVSDVSDSKFVSDLRLFWLKLKLISTFKLRWTLRFQLGTILTCFSNRWKHISITNKSRNVVKLVESVG